MQFKKSTKSANSNSIVVFGSSHYQQQASSGMKKTGCGCGKKKIFKG
ncbi:hypothetical protein [Metabacillus idriensis]|nr:hypothetical protein [Metabacillus idriensis]